MQDHVQTKGWLVVGVLVALVGCTKPNPRSCIDGSCADPNFPFCDVSGDFGEGANTCIAVTCEPNTFVACSGHTSLVCNAVGNDYDPQDCDVSCDPSRGCIECVVDNDCEASAPHCDAGGQCVQCIDSKQCGEATKPFCDDSAHTCRGCAIDDECDSKVCDDTAGTCVSTGEVIYAAPDGIAMGCGSLAVPCTFQGAINLASAARKIIKLLPGVYGGASVRSKSFTIHGDGATLTGLRVSNNDSFVTILGAKLELDSSAGASPVVTCDAVDTALTGNVVLDRVSVTVPQNGVIGCNTAVVTRSSFRATGAAAGTLLRATTVSRSRFEGGGLQMPTAGAGGLGDFAENCLFINSKVEGGTQASVRFSTLIDTVVVCGIPGSPQPNNVKLTNDIMVSSTAIETGVCDNHYVVAMPAPPTGGANDHVLVADPKFLNAGAGDYHLMSGSPAIDAADPAATTPNDFDNNPRTVGSAKDIGAFEFKP